MKKSVLSLLVALCLLLAVSVAVQAEELEAFYNQPIIGYVSPYTPQEWLDDPSFALDEELIFVNSPYLSYWMPVPKNGMSAEQYYDKGVRFTIDATSNTGTPEGAVLSIIKPLSLELAGEKVYGVIMDIGDDFIELELYTSNVLHMSGSYLRFAIDVNTSAYKGDHPYTIGTGAEINGVFRVGHSCELIYDPETFLTLTLWESNG